MKKNIFGLSLCAIALSGLMMVSCETETVYEVADVPSLTVSSALTVSYDGGDYSFTYSVTNPDADGYATCSADVSWISDVTDNSGKVSFTVAANTTDALRNGNITVAYNYTGGYISKTVGVIQSAYEAPVLTVQPTAVTAAYGGGSYSFTYDVENAADDGELSCTTDATWVSGFDYSTYGTVSFTVSANSGEDLRDCEITVKYSYNSGSSSVSKTVAVVQDHPGSGSNGGGGGDVSDFVGTYTCSGITYNEDYDGETVTVPGAQNTWTMKVYASSTGGLILDGLVPDTVDYYPEYPYYIAQASVSGSNILVYPQFTGYYTSSYGTNLYICWVLCPYYFATDAEAVAELGEGYNAGWYYSSSTAYPCTFSSTGTDTWTSDYGMFLGLSTTSSSLSGFYSYYDVFAPGMVITKTSSSTSSLTTISAITHPIDEKLILHKDFLCAD